jgi:fido (protein-threonine AMPylation protein)
VQIHPFPNGNGRHALNVNSEPGGTPAQRLDLAFRKVLTVSKEELLKEEGKLKQKREKQKAKRKRLA